MVKAAQSRLIRLAALLISMTCLGGCLSSVREVPFGIQEDVRGFVPARIAVRQCQVWPAGARYASLPQTNVDQEVLDDLCKAVDRFIIEGFSDQPYMNGFTPRLVAKLLAKAGQTGLEAEFGEHWRLNKDFCSDCRRPATAYQVAIASQPGWQDWLNRLSVATRSADAYLMPFISFAYDRSYDDRGIIVKEKAAELAILLINTNNGQLLWTSGRQGVAARRDIPGEAAAASGPTFEDVKARLLISEVWREFPGRIVQH